MTCAQAYLDGQGGLPEVLDCAERTRQSVEEHSQQMQTRLQQEAPHVLAMIQPELQAWRESCGDFLQWTRVASESGGSSAPLESLCSGLPVSSRRLQFDGFRLDHAIWVSRGPSTFAPINRLLAAAAQGFQLDLLCQQEAELLNHGLTSLLEGYPSELHPHLAPCLESILDWMDQPPTAEQLPEWTAEGEQLGKELARFDLAFLLRGYSGAPTTYPPLNLALNACWLQQQGFVAPELTQFLLQDAIRQVGALPPPDEGELPEIFEDMESLLGQLLKQCQRGEDLTALHQATSEVAQEFQEALADKPESEQARCSVCHQAQPLGTRRCSLCGSTLSASASADEVPQDRLERMLALAEALMQDSECSQALDQELQSYRRDMQRARQFREEVYSEILDQFENGLAALEEHLQEPDRSLLNEGSAQLREAESRLKRWREENPGA
ncbi:hypothetical protein JST97_05625 [bacterium]|nr:hypothetical protein [bacterium]